MCLDYDMFKEHSIYIFENNVRLNIAKGDCSKSFLFNQANILLLEDISKVYLDTVNSLTSRKYLFGECLLSVSWNHDHEIYVTNIIEKLGHCPRWTCRSQNYA